MLVLPRNVSALVNLASADVGRYAINGVNVQSIDGGNSYRIEATDGKVAGIVTGISADSHEHMPDSAAYPNGATSALIPAAALKAAGKKSPKPPKRGGNPAVANIGIVMGEHVSTLVSGNGGTRNVDQAPNVEGRFPCIDKVIPEAAPIVSLRFNPEILCRLLEVAAQFSGGDAPSVTIDIFADNRPIRVTADRPGQKFVGLAMPLSK